MINKKRFIKFPYLVFCLCMLTAGLFAQSVPFPHHTQYTAGTIKPDTNSQAQMDSSVEQFYTKWKKHYIRYTKDKRGAYVYCNADGLWRGGNKSANSVSLSEGHGYGMMIMVLMAGYDQDAHIIFDKMATYFKTHPSNINHHLMAWDQTADSVINEHNSDDATDGDMDIAYAFLMADKQWGSLGKYNYLQEAKDIINALKQTNLNPETHTMIMGDFTEKGEPYYNDTRTSDFIPGHLRAFAKTTRDSSWMITLNKGFNLLAFMQKRYSPAAGLFPDFIKACNKVPKPAGPYFIEKKIDGDYSYNACRIPWRLASDYLVNGDPKDAALLRPINKWISNRTKNDPEKIRDGYNLDGKPIIGASGDNIVFIAPFGVGAMIDKKNQTFVNRIWDYAIHEVMSDEEYYGNTVKLLCMIVMSGNWWGGRR